MNYSKTVLIVTGGSIDLSLFKDIVLSEKGAYIIGVDKGLEVLYKLNIKPQLVIGDFDSANKGIRAIYTNSTDAVVLNPNKDLTDTHAAVLEALKMKPARIIIVGATGTRVDHMLGNIALLKLCLDCGTDAVIVDNNNRIRMINKYLKIDRKDLYGKYISCIPFSDKVTGIKLTGFKYNLQNADMIKDDTIGISNELKEEEGHITVDTGYLLVLETKD